MATSPDSGVRGVPVGRRVVLPASAVVRLRNGRARLALWAFVVGVLVEHLVVALFGPPGQ